MSKQRIGNLAQLLTSIYGDIHPPLYLIFSFAWNWLWGDSEFALRLPSLIAGLLSLPLLWKVACALVGEPAARWSVFLCALSPVHIWYSVEARLYAPMMLLALWCIALFLRLLDGENSRKARWLYALGIATSLALHYYLAALVVVLTLITLVEYRREGQRKACRWILIINALGLFLILAWVLFRANLNGFQTSQGYLRQFTPMEAYRFLFQWSWTGNVLAPSIDGTTGLARSILWGIFQAMGILFFARGLFGLWRARASRPRGPQLVLFLLALPGFLFVVGLLGLDHTYIERSLLAAVPFFFMIVGLGLVSWGTGRGGKLAALATLSMAVINLGYFAAFQDDWTVYKPKQDWRGLAAVLDEELQTGASGRPIYTPMPNTRSLSYYDPRIQHETNLTPSTADIEGSLSRLSSMFGEGLADTASAVVQNFEKYKAHLGREAQLMVHPIGNGTLRGLRLDRKRGDSIFYLIHNRWHPAGDRRVERLAKNPQLQVLQSWDLKGLRLIKLKEIG